MQNFVLVTSAFELVFGADMGDLAGTAAYSETDLAETPGSFDLTNRFVPQLGDSIISYDYVTTTSRSCTTFLDISDIALAQALKCSKVCPDATNVACKGHNAGWDNEEEFSNVLCATAADLKAVVESLYPAAVGYDTDAAALDTDETNDGYGQYRARLCDSVASDPLNSVNDRYAHDAVAVVEALVAVPFSLLRSRHCESSKEILVVILYSLSQHYFFYCLSSRLPPQQEK